MHPTPRRCFVVAALASSLALGACSSDAGDATASEEPVSTTARPTTTEAGGDLSAFCAAGAAIERQTSTIDSPDAAEQVFSDLDDTLTELEQRAPSEVSEDAKTFVARAREAVSSGDFTAFEDGTVDALVANFEAVCADAPADEEGAS